MGKLFSAVLGISLLAGIVLFFVKEGQKEEDIKIEVMQADHKISVEKFRESLEHSKSELARTKESKAYHLKKQDEHTKAIDVILKDRKEKAEKAKKLEKNSDKDLEDMRKALEGFE